MKGIKSDESKCFDQADSTMESLFKLVVKSGVHSGGEFHLTKACTLIVGSDLDADIILQDESVAARHCLILSDESGYLVRALDQKVVVGSVEVGLLKDKRIALDEELRIGEVILALTKENAETGPGNVKKEKVKSSYLSVNWLLANKPVLASLVFVFVVTLISLIQFISPKANASFEMPESIAGNFQEKRNDNSLDIEDLSRGNSVRISRNVEEIMRLSGIEVESRTVGNGVVEITGHFGDGSKVSEIVSSRSIREIRGLIKIISRNLDQNDSLPISIVSVVDGNDPYVVLEDGAIYYVGSHFPNGYELAGVDGSDVIVNTANGTKRALGINAWNFETTSAN